MTRAFDLAGKTAVVATMHGKQAAIEPALARLGLRFLPPPPIDTDRYGTFTRDVARAGSQLDAVLAKARAGLALAPEADYAIASEGSFGPHPSLPFVASGFEVIALLPRDADQPLLGRHLTTATNYLQAEARSAADVASFAERVGLPRHAIVAMGGQAGPILAKGIHEPSELHAICARQIEARGSVWLEADMRAHHNPTRMEAIAAAAADLARRLQARCPTCDHPDWTARTRNGRPCAWCDAPTHEAWLEEYRCDSCGHHTERIIEPERKADPGRCNHCNP